MALDLTGLLTEDPGDPANFKYVAIGDSKGWLPLSAEDIAQRAADAAAIAAPSQQALIAYADTKFEAVQSGGCVVGGVPVYTTIKGLTMLNGAVARANANPAAVANWVVDATTTVQLDAATVTAIGLAVSDWVQSCYDALSDVYAAIMADEITTFAEIDAATWPSNA